MKFLKIYYQSDKINYVRLDSVQEICDYRVQNTDYRSKIVAKGIDSLAETYYSIHKPEDAIQQVVEL